MDLNLLRSKMILKGLDQVQLGEKIGVTRATMSARMRKKNRIPFRIDEVYSIIQCLELTPEDVMAIFFSKN